MVERSAQLDWGDYTAIGGYFVVVLLVGFWSTFRPNRDTSAGYFLAGKDMTWLPIGASIFASNIGAGMFVGLAGTGAASGFAVAIYEWHAIYLLIMLGWMFVPVYVSSGALTMPQFLKKRYGGKRIRLYLSVYSLVNYVLTRIPGEIYSGAIFIQQIVGWNIYLSVCLLLAVTAVYTTVGGLAAVIYTDTLQTVILLFGSIVVMIVGLVRVGDWEGFQRSFMLAASNRTFSDPEKYACALPREDSFHIWRDPVTGDIPWPGAATGLTIMGMFVWCNDQIMVQRCLSAKNLTHAKAGSLLAGTLKLTSFFLFVIPGMVARILFPEQVACSNPEDCLEQCGNEAGCTNIAYPLLVLNILPGGFRGIMLAAMLAAMMSSLTSIYNSASSMVTMDVWHKWRPRAKERELMIVGRLCVLILTGLSIVFIPVLESSQGGQLWAYLQAIASYIVPPWAVVFLGACFWKRTTEAGAFWSLMVGAVVGGARMVLDFAYRAPACGSGLPDPRPAVLAKVNFLHFASILTLLCAIVMVAVSLITQPRPKEKLHHVTWWTRNDKEEQQVSESEESDIDEEEVNEATVKMRKKRTVKRTLINWACGHESEPKPKLTAEEKEIIRKKMTSLAENPFWSRVLDVTAIFVASFTAFLLGFFG